MSEPALEDAIRALAHYLDRLRRTAEGEDVGPDPWADRRVPTPGELGRP